MSLGRSTTDRGPSSRPHATISCQELLSTGDVSHSGFLRKEPVFKRKGTAFIGTIVKSLKINWVQRYVVLSAGSLYHYNNEMGTKPTGSYSLKGFNKVVRAGEFTHNTHPWAFKIVHESANASNNKYFSAPSEADWKKWQHEIRSQLAIANGLGREMPDGDLDDPVYCPPDDLSAGSRPNSSEVDSDDDDEYLEIDEERIRGHQNHSSTLSRPLPALPASENDTGKSSGKGRKKSSQIDDDGPKILALMNKNYSPDDDDDDDDDDEDDDEPAVNFPPRKEKRPPAPLPTQTNHKDKPLPTLPSPKTPKTPKTPPNRALPKTPTEKYREEPAPEPTSSTPTSKIPKFGVQMMGFGGPQVLPKPQGGRTPPKPMDKPKAEVQRTPSDLRTDRPVPMPPTFSKSKKPVLPKPPVSEESSQERLSWKDFFWDGHDRDACQQILKNIGQEGVFMVRDSDAGHGQTLMCYSSEEKMVKKYKITTTTDGLYTIRVNSEWTFSTIEKLLIHYMHNNLPNRTTQLTAPYNKVMK